MKKIFVTIVVTAMLLAACSATPKLNSSSPTSNATSNQPSNPVNTQPAPSLSADQVYQAVADAWDKSTTGGPRHISQNSSKGGQVISNTEADSVPPDYHQVVTVMGNVIAEQYFINGTFYNNVQGVWSQTPNATAALSTIGGVAKGLSADLVQSDGKVLGIEAVNGSPAIVYSYSTTLKSLNATAQYKLWVDQTLGLPVKFENITSDGMTIDETITYDSSISITLSAEAKNAPIK
jgi:hypothetical protein